MSAERTVTELSTPRPWSQAELDAMARVALCACTTDAEFTIGFPEGFEDVCAECLAPAVRGADAPVAVYPLLSR